MAQSRALTTFVNNRRARALQELVKSPWAPLSTANHLTTRCRCSTCCSSLTPSTGVTSPEQRTAHHQHFTQISTVSSANSTAFHHQGLHAMHTAVAPSWASSTLPLHSSSSSRPDMTSHPLIQALQHVTEAATQTCAPAAGFVSLAAIGGTSLPWLLARRLRRQPEPFEGEFNEDEFEDGEFEDLGLDDAYDEYEHDEYESLISFLGQDEEGDGEAEEAEDDK